MVKERLFTDQNNKYTYFDRLKCLWSPHIWNEIKKTGTGRTLGEGLFNFTYTVEYCESCGMLLKDWK